MEKRLTAKVKTSIKIVGIFQNNVKRCRGGDQNKKQRHCPHGRMLLWIQLFHVKNFTVIWQLLFFSIVIFFYGPFFCWDGHWSCWVCSPCYPPPPRDPDRRRTHFGFFPAVFLFAADAHLTWSRTNSSAHGVINYSELNKTSCTNKLEGLPASSRIYGINDGTFVQFSNFFFEARKLKVGLDSQVSAKTLIWGLSIHIGFS